MTLTEFIARKEHVAKLKALRPLPPRAIGVPMLVLPRSNRYWLIGTAFDYLVRFETQRRAPHAKVSRWAARLSLERLFGQVRQADGSLRSLIPDDQLAAMAPLVAGDPLDDIDEYVSLGREGNTEVCVFAGRKPGEVYHPSVDIAQRVGRRALKIIEHAQATCEEFIGRPHVNHDEVAELARCSIRLAKIDVVLRASRVDPALIQEPEADDVQELTDLLGIVPFDSWLHQEPLILNPSFGEASTKIGGADSDLIAGDLLVDFKTTKQESIDVQSLDQLLGYYLLARNERTRDPRFPAIKRLGLYFARHGYLWERPVTDWVDHPQFAEIERWFLASSGLA